MEEIVYAIKELLFIMTIINGLLGLFEIKEFVWISLKRVQDTIHLTLVVDRRKSDYESDKETYPFCFSALHGTLESWVFGFPCTCCIATF